MATKPIRLLSDAPVQHIEDAAFGFNTYSSVLTDSILGSESPITVGIFGTWGTGKTSLMRLMFHRLSSTRHQSLIFPVWFNAWRYENEEHLILPLLYTIRDQIAERNAERNDQLSQFSQFLGKFIRVISAGISAERSIGSLNLKFDVSKSLNAVDEFMKEDVVKESLYYDAFQYLQKHIRSLRSARFVVFVDDLDRCEPKKMLHLMESIKLLLDFPGLDFVFGVDRTAVERAVVHKYSKDSGIDSRSYIKKLISVSFFLPWLQSDDVKRYTRSLLADFDSDISHSIAQITSASINPNPREIKRLINDFIIVNQLHVDSTQLEYLFFFMVIQNHWPSLHQTILDDQQSFLQFCAQFANLRNESYETASERVDAVPFLRFLSNSAWDLFVKSNLDFSKVGPDDTREFLHFASVASYEPIDTTELQFEHTSEEVTSMPPQIYRWHVYPIASEWTLNRIDRVVYKLPQSSFSNPIRSTGVQEKFSITEEGWSNIRIDIEVHLKSGEFSEFGYDLDLSPAIAQQPPRAA